MDLIQLFNRVKYAEWFTIAVAAILQFTWLNSTRTLDRLDTYSFAFLFILFLCASIPMHKLGPRQRTFVMLAECLLATAAMTFGTFKLYGLVFMVIAAKASITLNRKAMIFVALFLILTHSVASVYVRTHYQIWHTVPVDLERRALHLVLIEAELFFASAIAVVFWFGRTLLSERVNRRQAERLSREVESMAVNVERSRIARDMHDTIGHSLTSLNIQLELTSKLLGEGDVKEAAGSLDIARQAAKSSLYEVRNTVRAMRSDDFNFKAAVDELTDRIKQQQQISFDVVIDEENLSPPCRHNLLFILRESLTNVVKHSKASKVTIKLAADAGSARLSVLDDGEGFDLGQETIGCGIKGIKERAAQLGGTVGIESTPGRGTSLVVTLPT